MTNLIKQRVVGLLLVLIAGIVFLPDLLDGQKQQTKEQFKKVPARPQSEASPIVTDFPTEEVLNTIKKAPQVIEIKADDEDEAGDETKVLENVKLANSTEKTHSTPNNSAPAATEKTKIAEDQTPVTIVKTPPNPPKKEVGPVMPKFEINAWILQLGSFKHKKNVDALEKRLTDAGFKVFVKPVQTKSGLLSKVFVGPELERKSLEKAQKTLKELTGLDGKITEFDPIN